MTHKIIHTSDYLLVVDDSEIKEGEYCINLQDKGNNIFPFMDMRNIGIDYNKKVIKKIIAHLPLNNSSILEGVDLLPPFSRHQEDGVEELAHTEYRVSLQPTGRTLAGGKYDVDINYESRIGFINGYNKAKEKYDDVLKWIDDAILLNPYYNDSPRLKEGALMVKVKLQSLSQPKMPVEFECEIEYFYMASKMFYQDADWVKCNKAQYESIREEIPTCPLKKVHKEISTPEGHCQWVGKYIY